MFSRNSSSLVVTGHFHLSNLQQTIGTTGGRQIFVLKDGHPKVGKQSHFSRQKSKIVLNMKLQHAFGISLIRTTISFLWRLYRQASPTQQNTSKQTAHDNRAQGRVCVEFETPKVKVSYLSFLNPKVRVPIIFLLFFSAQGCMSNREEFTIVKSRYINQFK